MNTLEELFANAGDRDVGDLDLLIANQREQEVERSREVIELDDEASRRRLGLEYRAHAGPGRSKGAINRPANPYSRLTGLIHVAMKRGAKYKRRIRISSPYAPTRW
jgi:hypothetical protein